jgi:hypothetical protein
MSILVATEKIEYWRSQLTDYPEALAALTVLADCEGDLEDAAITIALQVGQEPETSDRWIEGLAKRYRVSICEAELREKLEDDLSGEALTLLKTRAELPLRLVTLVAIYAIQSGLDTFCKPLEEKLV